MIGRPGTRAFFTAALACAGITLSAPAGVGAGGAGPDPVERLGKDGLFSASTGPRAELVETVPITRRPGARPRVALALPLPRLKRGDELTVNAEVTATTTCVEPLPRCIGRSYRFDPFVGARIMLAGPGGRGVPVSAREELSCEQTRPNRNHHCPITLTAAAVVPPPKRLPCAPSDCRLEVVVDAHHPRREGGEVIVVGADRPDGSVEGGKARLSATVARADTPLRRTRLHAGRQRVSTLPPSGSPRVVLSQRLNGLRDGDVLLLDARQRTRIRELPYFVAAKVIVAARPGARKPGRLGRRLVTRAGTMTETNGFNCTVGPSAFRSPCRTDKVGLAEIKRTPRDARGRSRPLYANLVMRSFPKIAQARGAYPPARVGRRGGLEIRRVRVAG